MYRARDTRLDQGAPGKHVETRVLRMPGAPAGAEGKAETVLGNAIMPQLSADGRWLAYTAYTSGESGKAQVYVQPFPTLVGKWQISTDGGSAPRWARNGRELFYRNGDKMMAVGIEIEGGFRAGTPKMLFENSYGISTAPLQPGIGYDVSPDGGRFLMIKPLNETTAPAHLRVVENWFDELRRRVPIK